VYGVSELFISFSSFLNMFKYLFLDICVVIWLFIYGLFNDDVNILDYEKSSSCLQLQVEILPGWINQSELF